MTTPVTRPEVWLRGPVADVPGLLQPVAHALLQAAEDAEEIARALPDELLWIRPSGAASAGFHLRHLRGVVDRLFTYARGAPLDEAQQAERLAEETPIEGISASELAAAFSRRVDAAIEELRSIEVDALLELREVGRARLPSTTLGLLFHAAEHSQRHVGQLLLTARVVRAGAARGKPPNGSQ